MVKHGSSDYDARSNSWLIVILIYSFILFRIGVGMHDANKSDECKVHSINDIIISPAYAIGCNMAKDRFDLKLN